MEDSRKDGSTDATACVRIHDRGDGLFVLRVDDAAGGHRLRDALAQSLLDALSTLATQPGLRALIIEGGEHAFLHGGRADLDAAMARGLYRALLGLSVAAVAAVRGDATGAGFLFASLCDFVVCDRDAACGFSRLDEGLVPSAAEFDLFAARFGVPMAWDLLYRMPAATAGVRGARGWTCRIASADAVAAQAERLARDLAAQAGPAQRLLCAQRRAPLIAALEAWTPVGMQADAVVSLPVGATVAGADVNVDVNADDGIDAGATDPFTCTHPAPGVLRVHIGERADALQTVAALEALDAPAGAHADARALVLTSAHPDLLPPGDDDVLLAAAQRLHRWALRTSRPVVVALSAVAGERGRLLAHAFDAVVQAEAPTVAGRAADEVVDPVPSRDAWCALAVSVLGTRLPLTAARALVLDVDAHAGAAARAPCETVPQDQVERRAIALAQAWAAWPNGVIAEARGRAFPATEVVVEAGTDAAASSTHVAVPGPLDIASPVLQATRDADGIVSVRMLDLDAKNLFTPALVQGLADVFARIAADPACKVVVLSGYDRYFSTGGTRETLQDIQAGKVRFTDAPVFVTALRCPVPVIAAMQGHAVGGGLSLGLFADFALFAAESQYLNPYLRYGFTPGGGATLIVPDILGPDLGHEALHTALEYAGNELHARNPALAVHPRAELSDRAIALARRLARHPRERLIALKAALNRPILDRLDAVFAREIEMHAQSFVGRADALERIHAHFGPDVVATPAAAVPVDASHSTNEYDMTQATSSGAPAAPPSRDEIIGELRTLLAQELHLSEHEIGEGVPFVDLGLDSITGVTWVRRINARFGTHLPATRVYSHPTLIAMTDHVEEALSAGATATVSQSEPEQPQPQPAVVPAATPAPSPASAQMPTRDEIVGELRTLLALELHLSEHEIGEGVPFVDLGLDSITGVTWVRRINTRFGLALPATQVYSHPTLAAMAGHVEERLLASAPVVSASVVPHLPAATAPAAPAQPVAAVVQDAATPTAWGRLLEARGRLTSWRAAPAARETARQVDAIAIVGMAGQFPQARDIEAYWTNLAEGRLCVEEVPRERWDMAAYYQPGDPAPGKANARWMGCLPDYDRFDPLFFDISPKEAISMDPQQRMFLQTAWHAIEHAGYNPRALSGSRCGVFVGCGPSDYHLLSGDLQSTGLGFTGNDTSILAARVSYVLNLQGPCLTVETACSSSLVAISVACDNLVNETCDAAVAGGVGIIATQHLFLKMAQTGMLSPDGRCFTFDQRANGFVPGEAVGALLLKRLADAERDGDAIHGVIRGWGVNQDGKTNGITAPNPDAQARLQQDVYARFGIDPSAIQMVEAHGTGTKLGDPIEVEALKRAFASAKTPASCALGSVKSNIGHCFTAAGVASVIKVLLSLRHATMPPTINYARLNEHIDLKGTPFYINDRLRPWPAPASGARLAAVSSFGFGGTNAHLVIGEYAGATDAASDSGQDALHRFGKLPFVLSARSVEQLDAQARQLLDLLTAQGDRIPLTRLACTLQTGREAMDERLGVMAGSTDELIRLLRRHLAGESEAGRIFRGTARDHRKTMALLFGDADMCAVVVDRLLQQRQWSRLLELWTHGLAVDWTRLYGDARPRRLGLPGYPFARQRYWVESTGPRTGDAGAVETLHPFVHRNVSTLRQHAYATSFRGTEAFMTLPDGGASGTLPASACLEMARAAIEQAWDGAPCAGWRLTDIAWGEPCVSTATGASLSIALVPTSADSLEFEIYGRTGDVEHVHCQGRAQRVSAADADLQTVAAERSLTIDLPGLGLEPSVVVHPWLIESVLHALGRAGAVATDAQPIALASLWVSAPCRGPMTATVAQDADGSLSAALYDTQGRLCAGWTGLQTASLHEVAFDAGVIATDAAVAVAMPAPSAPRLGRAELMRGLRESLARALYLQPADIANDKAFTELGLDSIVGVEWINELNKTYGIRLAAARLYDYSTLDELSTHLEVELAKLAPAMVASAPAAAPVVASVPAAVAVAASAPRLTRAELMRGLRESLARALYLQPADIANDKAFTELGLDSIVGVEWINELNKTYGIRLAAARLYDYPTLDELSTHLETELAKQAPPVLATVAAVPVAAVVPAVASAPRLGRAELMRGLRESLARALYLQPADIANDKAFTELGLDSIVGVEWINELNKTYGIRLAAARLYDYPTLDELSTHLETELAKLAPPVIAQPQPQVPTVAPTAMPVARPAHAAARRRLQRRTRAQDATPVAASVAASAPAAATRRSGSGRIAVVGMSGRYPQAGDLAQYWTNLSEGRNAISEVPPSRWDVAKFFDPDPRKDGGIYCKWIGMLDDIESFDPLFFRISPAEAKNMDPQHRLFLEESYRAFEHAGYARQTLSGSKCGVYVGIIGAEYASLVSSAVDITGSNLAIGAARIAYFLNLKGPAIAIDTACSASLVAIHLACQGLLSHETDMALAGGVSVYLHPETYMGMCRAGMLSPDGQCRTFDDRANGFVPGEGVGAVVLKRLEDAERDRDTIYGVILGSAINQDGKTNGITAPSVNSQIELERGLYAEHDIHPETISYVETHGTGTKLGDPIELEALSTVFRERTQKRHFCALGSVKSNIGHASGAAGVASVQKVLLCMQHRTLVPSLNVTKENTLFDFADSPFFVSKTTRAWDSPEGTPRRAAVSSFGFSGTNAHLVIEEYLPSTTTAPAARVADPLLVVLSARTAGQLKRRVRDLQGVLAAQRKSGTLDLPSIAYTLLEGREALDERLALVVRSIDELATGLEAFLDGATSGAGWCSGKVQRDEDGLPRISADGRRAGDVMALAQAWVQGDTLTWAMLNVGAKVRRIALPTYPFAAKRYWVDPAVAPKPAAPAPAAAAPPASAPPASAPPPERPAPTVATAVAGQRSYRLDPATLASCLRAGDTAAPAAAFLEIVRMSLADAADQAGTPVLADVVWGQPLRPAPEREIEVALLPQQNGVWAFEIHSAARGAQGSFDEQVHCQGLVRFATTPSLPGVDLAALRGRLSAVARTDDETRIETVFRNGHELLVSLRPLQDTGRGGDLPAQRIDRIDAALRATAWLSRDDAAAFADSARPDALQAMFDAKGGPIPAWRWAWLRPAPGPAQQAGAMVIDIDLCDVDGAVLLRLAGATYDRLAWAPLQADPAAAPAQAPTATPPSARPHIALAALE